MPATQITRQINALVRSLRDAILIGHAERVTETLVRINVLDPTMQFMVKDRWVCVRFTGGRSTGPIGVMHGADYVEMLHPNGTIEVLKDRDGETTPPDWPEFKVPEPPSVWDHLMSEDTGS